MQSRISIIVGSFSCHQRSRPPFPSKNEKTERHIVELRISVKRDYDLIKQSELLPILVKRCRCRGLCTKNRGETVANSAYRRWWRKWGSRVETCWRQPRRRTDRSDRSMVCAGQQAFLGKPKLGEQRVQFSGLRSQSMACSR
jgi:hypothetical protein